MLFHFGKNVLFGLSMWKSWNAADGPPASSPALKISSKNNEEGIKDGGEEKMRESERGREKHIGVGYRLRVNSNASLQKAQWSTLYPCMSRSTGTAAWRKEGGHTRTRAEEGGGEEGWTGLWHDNRDLCYEQGLPTLTLLAWDTHFFTHSSLTLIKKTQHISHCLARRFCFVMVTNIRRAQ